MGGGGANPIAPPAAPQPPITQKALGNMHARRAHAPRQIDVRRNQQCEAARSRQLGEGRGLGDGPGLTEMAMHHTGAAGQTGCGRQRIGQAPRIGEQPQSR